MVSDLGLHCLLRSICPNTYSFYGIFFFSVNGKPEPLQTNEVKHIKKELRQIRDMCNQLLDKLDQREPQPGDNIVDSSTASIPKSKYSTTWLLMVIKVLYLELCRTKAL